MCLTLAVLAGCATGPLAGNQFDGVYVGNSFLVRGFGDVCGPPHFPVSILVKDGRFDYRAEVSPYGNPTVQVLIEADGSLSGVALYVAPTYILFTGGGEAPAYRYAWVSITGRVSGQRMTVKADDLRCTRQMTLQRQ